MARRPWVITGTGAPTPPTLRRDDRIQALRAVVRAARVVLAIDLGEDKQVATLMDHDSRVLARRTVSVTASGLGGLLGWATGLAVAHGFAGVVVDASRPGIGGAR